MPDAPIADAPMADRHVEPTPAQFAAFRAMAGNAPVDLINLVRFRERAAYPAGHELADAGLSGADAFVRFIAQSGTLFSRVGGRMVWSGVPAPLLIGPADEQWDAAYIVHYPSADAFLAMVADATHRAAEDHRRAAVATTRIIPCAPRDDDADFVWP